MVSVNPSCLINNVCFVHMCMHMPKTNLNETIQKNHTILLIIRTQEHIMIVIKRMKQEITQ